MELVCFGYCNTRKIYFVISSIEINLVLSNCIQKQGVCLLQSQFCPNGFPHPHPTMTQTFSEGIHVKNIKMECKTHISISRQHFSCLEFKDNLLWRKKKKEKKPQICLNNPLGSNPTQFSSGGAVVPEGCLLHPGVEGSHGGPF